MDPTPALSDIDQLDRQLSGGSPQASADRDTILDILASGTTDASLSPPLDSARAWDKVQSLIATSGPVSAPRGSRRPAGLFNRRIWIVASAAIGCLTAVIVGLRTFQRPALDTRALRVVSTTSGQQTTFKLPDGSTVQLAPESRVEFTKSFGVSTRAVRLSGEAVFTVTHHTGTPFTVHAEHATVRVLGTTFGVRAYSTDDSVRVAVAEGKVGVENGPVLTMGELATVAPDGESVVTRGDVVSPMSWTQGRLIYHDVPLKRIVEDVERWYGLTLHVGSALSTRRVTTEFTESTVVDALAMLARTLDVRYEHVGSQITFGHGERR